MPRVVTGALLVLLLWTLLSGGVGAGSWIDLLGRADSLSRAENYDSAVAVGRLALAESRAALGAEHVDVARVLQFLAECSLTRADYAESVRWAGRALAMRERLLGADHLDLVECLTTLGSARYYQASYDSADATWRRALVLQELRLGPDHPEVARTLLNLAAVVPKLHGYQAAIPLLSRALAISEQACPPNDTLLADCHNSLGIVYCDIGRFAEAEQHHKLAQELWEKSLGPNHSEVAISLNNRAVLYSSLGRYAEAEPLLERARAILERRWGPDDPRVAVALHNSAGSCLRLGDPDRAERYMLRALEIYRAALGAEHPRYAKGRDLLVSIYRRQGKYAEAKQLLEGPLDPRTTDRLSLAALLVDLKDYAEAERQYGLARDEWVAQMGSEYHGLALCLGGLGDVYLARREYSRADSVYTQALRIAQRSFGPDHYKVADCIEDLCRLRRLQWRRDEARDLALAAYRIRAGHFAENGAVLSEKDALRFSASLRRSVDLCLSCCADIMAESGNAYGPEAAEVMIGGKGVVSDGVLRQRELMIRESDSSALASAESLRYAKYRLAALTLQGPGEDVRTYTESLDSLRRTTERLEVELARASASYDRGRDRQAISAERLSQALPSGSALIEYFRYRYEGDKLATDDFRYLAAVMRAGAQPMVVELGAAAAIDSMVDRYRCHLTRIAATQAVAGPVDQQEFALVGRALSQTIWAPVAEYARGCDEVIVAPDGSLNLVSFGCLYGDDGAYLIEKHGIHYLSAGRYLLGTSSGSSGPASGLLALADPDYDARSHSTDSYNESATSPPAACNLNGAPAVCAELRNVSVSALPGTRAELDLVVAGWRQSTDEPVTPLVGAEATEENFKSLGPGKRVIHLATHGYFLESGTTADTTSEDNPLLLSGFLLAGANRLGERSWDADGDDGIMTAYEVSALDLRGTELVVLSACETALGRVRSGEGVYGLRRAFQVAGVRTVVSALWPVPDHLAAEMLGGLYDRRGLALSEAIRRAQLRCLERLRSQGRPDHPFEWGAFVAYGDWP